MAKKFLATLAVFLGIFSFGVVHAVDVDPTGLCDQAPDSAVCKDKNTGTDNPIYGEKGVLTIAINVVTAIVAIIAIITIILAGLKLITSGNNPQDVSAARERIIYAVVALVIAAIAQLIVKVVIDRIVKA